jgi:hypothetical protein
MSIIYLYFKLYMYYAVEAVFVGIYSVVIWLGVSSAGATSFGSFATYFITGFLKHYLGYWLGLHDYYLRYGDACRGIRSRASKATLVQESILEGVWFMGWLTLVAGGDAPSAVFMVGAATHIAAEWSGLHRVFCLRGRKKK